MKRRLFKIILFVIAVVAIPVAVSVQPEKFQLSSSDRSGFHIFLDSLHNVLSGSSLTNSLITVAAYLYLYKKIFNEEETSDPLILLLSFFFSLFMLIGDSFSNFCDFRFIFYGKIQIWVAFLVLTGKWIPFYFILLDLYKTIGAVKKKPTEDFKDEELFSPTFRYCLFLLLTWFLLSLPFFPGSLPHDGRVQLNMFFGVDPMTLHHPWISTLFLGSIYRMGSFFSGEGGIAAVAIIQSIFGAYVFSSICNYIREKVSPKLAFICLLFYAFAPMWWTYMVAVMKDTMYFILFAFYSFLIQKYITEENHDKFVYVKITITSILLCLFRNNGIYIVFPSLLFLFFAVKKTNWKILCVLFCTTFTYITYSFVVTDILKLSSVNQVEPISVPLQQIARYVGKHKGEITHEEAAVIDKIVVYEGIETRYNPFNADPVKNRYKIGISYPEIYDFFELYIKYFINDPLPFLEGAMNHAFGYFDPDYIFTELSVFQLYIKGSLSANDGNIVYAHYLLPEDGRTKTNLILSIWEKIPMLAQIIAPASYTWLVLFVLVGLLRLKNYRYISLLTAPLFNILICCVSPVTGYLRYTLPIMAAAPLYIILLFENNKNNS